MAGTGARFPSKAAATRRTTRAVAPPRSAPGSVRGAGEGTSGTSRHPPRPVPVPLSRLVGRDQEVEDVAKLVEGGRLVTLTGPSGVGKTRLALEVATTVGDDYVCGAWLVELASIADPKLLAQAVASALGVGEEPGRPLGETLVDQLGNERLLVLLDNCEHLLESCARLAGQLLVNCRGLHILATSQEPLCVPGEIAWPVPSLSVPAASADPPEALFDYEAVRLFVERAQEVRPGFALTAEVAPAVAEICRRLDGNPLAIELAAARVPVLSPRQIAARLGNRFRFLAAGSRTALPRHRSLRAALDWSHDLLSGEERALLRRLSVFSDGWTLESAEEVCAGDDIGADDVFDLLAALARKSLVVAETALPEARYRLLDTIHAYARDRLAEAGEADAVRARHLGWFLSLAEEAEPELVGSSQQIWLRRLHPEQGNIRAALEWAAAEGRCEEGLRLAAALSLFWRTRGCFSEGRSALERALASAGDAPSSLRAKAWWGAGFLAAMAGDYASACSAAEYSQALARTCGDTVTIGRGLYLLGLARSFTGDTAGAVPVLEESLALAESTDDRWSMAGVLSTRGRLAMFRGDPAVARPSFEAALQVAQKSGDKQNQANALIGLGWVALAHGDYRPGEEHLSEALEISRDLADPFGLAVALSFLGDLARSRGNPAGARLLLEEGLTLGRAVGSPIPTANSLASLGRVEQGEGNAVAARPLFDEALSVAGDAGLRVGTAASLDGLGEAARLLGDAKSAFQHFQEALRAAQESGNKAAAAHSLYQLGRLARLDGDHERGGSLHHEALVAQHELGDVRGVVESLEALAGLAIETGRWSRAGRLLGAAQSLRDANGYARSPLEQRDYDADVARVRDALSDEETTVAWADGAMLSLDEAVAYASRGRGERQRPPTGWASLTPAERDVVRLVADGLTNAEIGERLFISRRTVQAHLAHVFPKVGVASRRELAREANSRRRRRAGDG